MKAAAYFPQKLFWFLVALVCRVDRVTASSMIATWVPSRCAAEILTGPRTRFLSNNYFPFPRFMGHGGKLFGGWLDCGCKDRVVRLCVCFCVWAALVDICSPHLENILVRNNFVSEFDSPANCFLQWNFLELAVAIYVLEQVFKQSMLQGTY